MKDVRDREDDRGDRDRDERRDRDREAAAPTEERKSEIHIRLFVCKEHDTDVYLADDSPPPPAAHEDLDVAE